MLRDSFMAVTIQRAGIRRGSDVCTFVLCWWALMSDKGGDEPTIDEYADHWKVSRATAYREQQRFREVWPEFETPAGVADALRLDVTDPVIPSLMSLPAPRPRHA